jgi:glucokinase
MTSHNSATNAKAAAMVASTAAAAGLLAYFLLRRSAKPGGNEPAEPASQPYLIGIDLGATNAKAGVVRGTDGALLASISEPLEAWDPPAVVACLVACVRRACDEAGVAWGEVAAVGVGAPGHVHHGVVKAAANFPAWKGVPLAVLLQAALGGGIPVRLVNDADAALAAECWIGAASRAAPGDPCPPRDVVLVTLGSGVGVAVLAAGAFLQGSRGLIEGGHAIVHMGDGPGGQAAARACGCGQRGCAEAYVSANSVRARFHEARVVAQAAEQLALQRPTPLVRLDTSDGYFSADEDDNGCEVNLSPSIPSLPVPLPLSMDVLSTAEVFALAYSSESQPQDPALAELAAVVVDETARILALFLVNLCRCYDPRFILLGGGMAEAGEPFLAAVRLHFEATRWTVLPDHVEVRQAVLGCDAGVVGAAAVVREHATNALSESICEVPLSRQMDTFGTVAF